MTVDSYSAGLTRVAFLSDISMYRLTDLPANGSWTRSGRLGQALRAKRRLFTHWVNLDVRPNWEGTRTRSMSRRQLPTPAKGVHGGNGMSVVPQRKYHIKLKAQPRYLRRYATRGEKKKRSQTSQTGTRAKEEKNETRSLKKERSVSSRLAYP